jgi:hypothetical protein
VPEPPVIKPVTLLVTSSASERFLRQLFDLIPGLVDFKVYSSRTQSGFLAKYETEAAAVYTLKKLNKFELASGDRVFVEYYDRSRADTAATSSSQSVVDQITQLIGISNNSMPPVVPNAPQDQLAQQNLSQLIIMSNLINEMNQGKGLVTRAEDASSNDVWLFFLIKYRSSLIWGYDCDAPKKCSHRTKFQ